MVRDRSYIMSRIRSTNTKPELIVRRLVYRMGYRYRLHARSLPGAPDLVFPSKRKAIFVHGCFWHSHEGCPRAHVPRTRLEYWLPKLERNRKRDAEAIEQLVKAGWKVLTVWECMTEDLGLLQRQLGDFLRS